MCWFVAILMGARKAAEDSLLSFFFGRVSMIGRINAVMVQEITHQPGRDGWSSCQIELIPHGHCELPSFTIFGCIQSSFQECSSWYSQNMIQDSKTETFRPQSSGRIRRILSPDTSPLTQCCWIFSKCILFYPPLGSSCSKKDDVGQMLDECLILIEDSRS